MTFDSWFSCLHIPECWYIIRPSLHCAGNWTQGFLHGRQVLYQLRATCPNPSLFSLLESESHYVAMILAMQTRLASNSMIYLLLYHIWVSDFLYFSWEVCSKGDYFYLHETIRWKSSPLDFLLTTGGQAWSILHFTFHGPFLKNGILWHPGQEMPGVSTFHLPLEYKPCPTLVWTYL